MYATARCKELAKCSRNCESASAHSAHIARVRSTVMLQHRLWWRTHRALDATGTHSRAPPLDGGSARARFSSRPRARFFPVLAVLLLPQPDPQPTDGEPAQPACRVKTTRAILDRAQLSLTGPTFARGVRPFTSTSRLTETCVFRVGKCATGRRGPPPALGSRSSPDTAPPPPRLPRSSAPSRRRRATPPATSSRWPSRLRSASRTPSLAQEQLGSLAPLTARGSLADHAPRARAMDRSRPSSRACVRCSPQRPRSRQLVLSPASVGHARRTPPA